MRAARYKLFCPGVAIAVICITLLYRHIRPSRYSFPPRVKCVLVPYTTTPHIGNADLTDSTDPTDPRIDIASLGLGPDLVYMFFMDRSNLAFYRSLKIWDDLVLIAERPEQCEGLELCLALQESFVYETLHDKVFKTLILLEQTFKGWNSISKLDDDVLLDIRTLRAIHPIHPLSYVGNFVTNTGDLGFPIKYATGPYYTMGRTVVQCVLEHKYDFYNLGSNAEDLAVGWVVSKFCKHEAFETNRYDLIWHKKFSGLNKVCILDALVS